MSPNLFRLFLLLLLCVQNAAITLTLRYSRGVLKEKWLISSSVVCMEIFKLVICVIMVAVQEYRKRINNDHDHPTTNPLTKDNNNNSGSISDNNNSDDDSTDDTRLPLLSNSSSLPSSSPSRIPLFPLLFTRIKFLILNSFLLSPPSFIYFLQNFLVYTALQNLESASYSILSQLKLFTTALFSVVMLGKKLTWIQWRALMLLFVGVILVQYVPDNNNSSSEKNNGKEHGNLFFGLLCVIGISVLSGFAGVYFEKVLKRDTTISVWDRNIQLSLWSIPTGLLWCIFNDYDKLITYGFFYGYSWVALSIILLNGFGGLLVSLVIQYADNILKGFATTCAIIFTSLVSYFIFHDLQITITFLGGGFCVILSIFNYNDNPIPTPPSSVSNNNNNPINNNKDTAVLLSNDREGRRSMVTDIKLDVVGGGTKTLIHTEGKDA